MNGLDRLEARVEVLTLGFELFDLDFDIPRIFPYELTLFLILPSVFVLKLSAAVPGARTHLGNLQMIRYQDFLQGMDIHFFHLFCSLRFPCYPVSFGHGMNNAGRDSRCASTGL